MRYDKYLREHRVEPGLTDYKLESVEVVKVTGQELNKLLEAKEKNEKVLDDVASVKEINNVAIKEVKLSGLKKEECMGELQKEDEVCQEARGDHLLL
ncbi:hypothetical protein Tco_1142856 [Tanacetum coccineum]